MAFSIKNDTADELLRELTELTGESLTTAVIMSLRERLERERRAASSLDGGDHLDAAVAHLRSLRADRDVEDAVTWDEHGLPT